MIYGDPVELDGRLLDRAVHEEGFGRDLEWDVASCAPTEPPCDGETRSPIPSYSGPDWHLVVDRLREAGYELSFRETVILANGLRFGIEAIAEAPDGTTRSWHARTLPTAVCRLALSIFHGEESDD